MASQQVDGVRRSSRRQHSNLAVLTNTDELKIEQMCIAFDELSTVFQALDTAAKELDIPLAPYLPEPKSFKEILRLPNDIQAAWIKAIRKEIKFLIENETFRRGEPLKLGDEVIPAMLIFKAKVTSRGYLDKLKARCCARGDLQQKSEEPDALWSPCVFARTFKMFVAEAVKRKKRIKQLDFIGAFCQGFMKKILFLQLPREYSQLLPEYAEYFSKTLLIQKSLYGTYIAAKVWNSDLTEWLTTNEFIKFTQSTVDPSLFVYRKGNDYLYLIIYVDDSL